MSDNRHKYTIILTTVRVHAPSLNKKTRVRMQIQLTSMCMYVVFEYALHVLVHVQYVRVLV